MQQQSAWSRTISNGLRIPPAIQEAVSCFVIWWQTWNAAQTMRSILQSLWNDPDPAGIFCLSVRKFPIHVQWIRIPKSPWTFLGPWGLVFVFQPSHGACFAICSSVNCLFYLDVNTDKTCIKKGCFPPIFDRLSIITASSSASVLDNTLSERLQTVTDDTHRNTGNYCKLPKVIFHIIFLRIFPLCLQILAS